MPVRPLFRNAPRLFQPSTTSTTWKREGRTRRPFLSSRIVVPVFVLLTIVLLLLVAVLNIQLATTASSSPSLHHESHLTPSETHEIRRQTTEQNKPPPQEQSIDEEKFVVSPRVFTPWPIDRPLPCYHPTDNRTDIPHWSDRKWQKTPSKIGMFYLKLLKVGSSTLSGIQIRIARNVARRQHQDFDVCKSKFLHGWAGDRMYRYGDRNQTAFNSFLWTIVRDPTPRYISEFFHFEHSRKGTGTNDASIIRFLRKGKHADHHYLSWLETDSYKMGRSDPILTAQKIIKDYDFIGVSERMDESIVALVMILRLRLADVLYISIKSTGSYEPDTGAKEKCTRIEPSFVSTGIKEYLKGDEWQTYIKPEWELYRAANRSLDMTIDNLGREEFEQQLAKYKHAQQIAKERCATKVKLPCMDNGDRRLANETDCVKDDLGCGFDCLDRVADELQLW